MGTLMDNVISKGPGYSEAEVKCLMLQLLQGLGKHTENLISVVHLSKIAIFSVSAR